MKTIEKEYGYHSSCLRHLRTLTKNGITYFEECINQIDEGCFILTYKIKDDEDIDKELK